MRPRVPIRPLFLKAPAFPGRAFLVYGEYKGIPKQQVREAIKSGKDVIMRIDVQGADTVHKICPDALLVFLAAKDEDELVRRLIDRKSDTIEDINLRIVTARKELERADDFDYIVENRDGLLERTVDIIESIICAEHHRSHPRRISL